MWREQQQVYRHRMGFRQEDLATVLQVSKETVVDYERHEGAATQPAVNKAAEYVQRMLVSLDWMGDTSRSMWCADTLRPMRSHVRTYITGHRAQLEAVSLDERICALIRETHSLDPERFSALILSGVCGFAEGKKVRTERRERAMELIGSILDGANPELANPTPDYLADFWQVSAPWLLNREGDPILVDVTPHLAAIRLLEEHGLLDIDFIMQNINVLIELRNATRLIGVVSQDEE